MAYREKQPLPLSLNFRSTVTSHSIHPPANYLHNASELSPSPFQRDDDPELVGQILIESISRRYAPWSDTLFGARTSCDTIYQGNHTFTPASPRPRPVLSRTFGYSFDSKKSLNTTSPSAANSNLSILLPVSPISIVGTSLTASPSSQHNVFSANHYRCQSNNSAQSFPTGSGCDSIACHHHPAKDVNNFEHVANQKNVAVAHSAPATDNNVVPTDYMSASFLSYSGLSALIAAPASHKPCEKSLIKDQVSAANFSSMESSSPDQMESSFPPFDPPSKNLTHSSSLTSTLSHTSTSEHHLKFDTSDLPSWPIPPSSSPFSSVNSERPRRAATYHPLRSSISKQLSKPNFTRQLTPMNPRFPMDLAYLDLSSLPRSQEGAFPQADSPTSHLGLKHPPIVISKRNGPQGKSIAATRKRSMFRSSQISMQSNATEGSVYEDAPDKAEWMDVDKGDAYDDLEKTQASVKRISQALSIMNGSNAMKRAAKKTQIRYAISSPKMRSPEPSGIPVVPTVHSNFSLPTARQVSLSNGRSNRSSDDPNSAVRSSLASDHNDNDSDSNRSKNEFDHVLMGSVPLFTRASLMRDDRDDDRFSVQNWRRDQLSRVDDEDLKITSPDLRYPSGGNPRRRLKPLILRPATPIVNPSRKRETISSKLISVGSSLEYPSLSGSSSSHLVPNYDQSHVTSDKSLTLSSAEAPSSRWHSNSGTGELASMDVTAISTQANVDHSNDIPFLYAMASPSHSAKSSQSHSEISNNNLVNHLKSPKVIELLQDQEMIHSSTTLGLEKSIAISHFASPVEKLAIFPVPKLPLETNSVISATGKVRFLDRVSPNMKGTATSPHTPFSPNSYLTEHPDASSLELPTLLAGSAKGIWSHSSPAKTSIDQATRKCHISNLLSLHAFSKESVRKSTGLISNSTTSKHISTPSQKLHLFKQPASMSGKNEEHASNSIGSKSRSKSNRMIASLSRMEAQEAKLLDLTSLKSEKARGSSGISISIEAKDERKLVKGKLERISQPVLLSGDDEKLALWRMIKNGKAHFR